MRGKATLLAATLLLFLTAGCTGAGSTDDGNRSPRVSAEAAAAPGDHVRDLTLAEEVEVDRAEDRLVLQCMRRQGFRYWPGPVASVAERRAGGYVVDDVDWARRYGYGRSFDIAAEKARRSHPNITYANALSERERIRYSRALDGDFDDVLTVELPSGGSVRTPREGCYAEASERLYGDHPAWFRSKKTVTSLTPLYVPKILEDQRLVTAVTAWSQCMRESGRPFESPDEIRRKRDALIRGMSEQNALESESALAVAEAECAQQTSLGKIARALEKEYREAALRDYAEESADYRQMRMTALTRARTL
ncbi:hypothetical protein ACFUTR_03610 [Streptomyces sp. NPDC057367]|uniref:hypothetical protein n=1 Tax=Streptomyces sp. NPDC057367 TaxID=3346108 RepID=UPI003625F895